MTTRPMVIHSDPKILGGTPVFVGTRFPLQNLIDCLEAGDSLDQFYSVSRMAGEDDRGILCYVRVRGRRERIPFKELVFDDYDPLSRIQRRYFHEWEKEHPTPPLLRWIFEGTLKETNREFAAKHRRKRQAPKTRRNK